MSDGPLDRSPPWAPGYRHLTEGIAPVAFRYRACPEDFVVEELPLFEPEGAGDHVLVDVEKRGLSTLEAAARLAAALGASERAVGFAGRKDAFAVTRQRFSIEHVEPDAARRVRIEGLSVLAAARHPRKLRLGQHAGNRFTLVLRDLAAADRPRVEAVLARLAAEGLPNYVGEQRFGRTGRTWELGRLLVQRRHAEYLAALVSEDHAAPGPARAELARVLERGTWSERRAAAALAPRLEPELAAVARQLARRPKHVEWAVRAVPKRARRFHLAAWQARVFNRVLAARLATPADLRRARPGDVLAAPDGQGRALCVEDDEEAAALAPRCAAFALVPTGPLPGARAAGAGGATAEAEAAALAAEGVEPAALAAVGDGLEPRGARRPLAVPVRELELGATDGGAARLAFVLPGGAYATTLLEELAKRFAPPA